MKLQIALDLLKLEDASRIAEITARTDTHILEAGTPLIESEGIIAVRELKKRLPNKTIFADMKIMDTGYPEMQMASNARADIVQVLGAALDDTIKEAINAGKEKKSEYHSQL